MGIAGILLVGGSTHAEGKLLRPVSGFTKIAVCLAETVCNNDMEIYFILAGTSGTSGKLFAEFFSFLNHYAALRCAP